MTCFFYTDFLLKLFFTKDKTCLALTEVEILALRTELVVLNCFVYSNDRLQRMAGIAVTKMPKPFAPEKIIE